jgi:hypothetical protein
VDGDLVGKTRQPARQALDPLDEECGIRETRTLRPPRSTREGVGGSRISRSLRGRLGPRAVQYVPPSRAHVPKNVANGGG